MRRKGRILKDQGYKGLKGIRMSLGYKDEFPLEIKVEGLDWPI
jgi:hypothetical protein